LFPKNRSNAGFNVHFWIFEKESSILMLQERAVFCALGGISVMLCGKEGRSFEAKGNERESASQLHMRGFQGTYTLPELLFHQLLAFLEKTVSPCAGQFLLSGGLYEFREVFSGSFTSNLPLHKNSFPYVYGLYTTTSKRNQGFFVFLDLGVSRSRALGTSGALHLCAGQRAWEVGGKV
jgi:hypothetical protein